MRKLITLLKEEGYNLWDCGHYNPEGGGSEISKYTPKLEALEFAQEKINNSCTHNIRSALK
jgi:hypothetical protein